jgi:hypothetical protein
VQTRFACSCWHCLRPKVPGRLSGRVGNRIVASGGFRFGGWGEWDNRLLMDVAAGLSPPVIAWEVWVGGGDVWSGHLQIGLCRTGLVGERTFVL